MLSLPLLARYLAETVKLLLDMTAPELLSSSGQTTISSPWSSVYLSTSHKSSVAGLEVMSHVELIVLNLGIRVGIAQGFATKPM